MRESGAEPVQLGLDRWAARWRRLVPVAVVVLLLTAASCGDDDDAGPEGSASSTSSTTASPRTTAATSPLPQELLARWHTVLPNAEAEAVTLRISETEYGGSWGISRGQNRASGTVDVRGDEIDFVAGSLCAGTGTYRWMVDGDSLRLTSVNHDPCGGRSEVLDGLTFTRGE